MYEQVYAGLGFFTSQLLGAGLGFGFWVWAGGFSPWALEAACGRLRTLVPAWRVQ